MPWLAIVLTFNFDSAKTHGSSKLIFNTAFYLLVVVNARYIVNLKVLSKLTLYLVVVNIPFVAVMIRSRVGFSITSICSLGKKIKNNFIIFGSTYDLWKNAVLYYCQWWATLPRLPLVPFRDESVEQKRWEHIALVM